MPIVNQICGPIAGSENAVLCKYVDDKVDYREFVAASTAQFNVDEAQTDFIRCINGKTTLGFYGADVR